jgi:CRP-like cAMP-binding protein
MLSLSDLLDRIAPQVLPAGSRLLTRGETDPQTIYLMSGQVSVGLWQGGRWVHRQGSIMAPDWVDLSSALLDGAVSFDAVTDTQVEIKTMSLAHFRLWLLDQPTGVQGMLRSLARQQKEWAETTLSRLAMDAHARCAQWLLHQAQVAGASSAVQLTQRKRQIAEQLGMAPETLSRILRDLREQGLIHGRGRTLNLVDPGRLRSLMHAA